MNFYHDSNLLEYNWKLYFET